jgi:hypothetical protein
MKEHHDQNYIINFFNLYNSPDFIMVLNNVACNGKMRNTYKILGWAPQKNGQYETHANE